MSFDNVSDFNNSVIHGGDIYRNDIRLDFSVNLNPNRIPDSLGAAYLSCMSELRYYPDPLHQDLKKAIANMDGADKADIICGNGASELIMAAVHAVKPEKALITAPCYAGYRAALNAEGAQIIEFPLSEDTDFKLTADVLDALTEDLDIVFLGDPNNPGGLRISHDLMERIKKKCRDNGICLVIDECFLPLTSGGTEPPEPDDAAVHLRAFTKTFSIPALRLGYMICKDRELLKNIEKHLPEWNVSHVAEKVGIAAAETEVGSSGYIRESVLIIENEREYLAENLTELGIKVFPSDTNFILIKSVPDLYDKLLAKGILIRRCANFSGLDETFFRLAVRARSDNEILIETLKEIPG